MSTPENPARGLRKKTARGIAWTLAGAIGTSGVRIAAMAALGRLLAPSDFGVVATAMTVMVLVQSIRDVGVGVAIIQRKDLEADQVDSAFAFSTWLGIALSGVMVLAAPLVGRAYDMPEAVPLLRVMALMFALRGVSTVPFTLCQREFRFRALATIDFVGYTIGSAASIALAAAGTGPWALVWGDLLETVIGVAILLYLRPPRWTLRVRWAHLRELLGFGVANTVAQIANVAATQGDNAVVGRVLGEAPLGYYSRAYDLVRFPSTMFTSIAGAVLYPAFATLQQDPERMGQAFRRALFATAVVLMPASAGLIVLAPEVIRLVIGPQWGSAVLPFQIMATTMLFRTSYKLGAIVARASGDVFGVAVTQAAYAVLVIGGAAAGVRWGISGVATTTAIAVFGNFVMLTALGLRSSTLGWGGVIAAHADGTIATGLVLATAWPVAWALRAAGVPVVGVIVPTMIVGAAGPAAMAWLGIRRRGSDWAWLWETMRGAVSKRAKKAAPPG